MNIIRLLKQAAEVATYKDDERHFRVGAVGIRGDGVKVRACNGAPKMPERLHHAEGRLCRKLDQGAIVFVARTMRNGTWAMSKPCFSCEQAMRRSKVKRAYYTISSDDAYEYGVIVFE